MKAILSILLCCACAVGAAEYLTLYRPSGERTSQVKVVGANETVRFVFYDFWDASYDQLIFNRDGDANAFYYSDSNLRIEPKKIPVFQGPGTLVLTNRDAPGDIPIRPSLATFEVIRHTPDVSLTTPSTAVVIPEDATGPVQIILESSTDLVNWTAANPGTYGASTSKRFFRVRAVKQ